MSEVRLKLFQLFIAPLSIACNKWDHKLPVGQLHSQGELIAEACMVEAGDRQPVVRMELFSSNRFEDSGNEAEPMPFSLHLQGCNPNVSDRIGIVFYGVADGKKPDVLSIGEGERTASDIGIGLFDEQGKLIPINAELKTWKPLTKGTRIL
ncbi:fimbrial protein [Izhakiella capsodis]|uniref:Fimbrial protein n=1 Tax=Izhakiella capsodis TaxID=1367852 RepID=A0A1I4X119_9GAMM|nr:fimbrial protein [Izhakiella capsodis]